MKGVMITVMICKSKINQYRERIHKILSAKVANRQLCVVYWGPPAVSGSVDSQVFRIPQAVPLPYDYYHQVLKAMCARVGLRASDFSSHSLRRGGQLSCACVGWNWKRSKKGEIGAQIV